MEQKNIQRDLIKAQVEAYKLAGGKITQCPAPKDLRHEKTPARTQSKIDI